MTESVDLVLISPPGGHYAERWSGPVTMPPLGLAYLASASRAAGYRVRIIDGRAERLSLRAIARRLREWKPRAIGVTCVTETRFSVAEVVRTARVVLPDSWIVMGGPHPSAAPEDTLEHLSELDAVFQGEGEEAIVACLNVLKGQGGWAQVAGLCWRDGKILVINPPTISTSRNLDLLPPPAWDLLNWKAYQFRLDVPGRGSLPAANMMTSRGCPWSCPFCMTPALSGKRIRAHGEDRILWEMETLRDQFGAGAIWFFDDTFTFQRKRVRDFCHLALARRPGLPWFCEIRVDSVDRELLELMRAAGCYKVGFGIESGDDDVLMRTGKGITTEQAKNVVRWCDELGLQSHAFFILGHPLETIKQAGRTLEFIEGLPKSCEPSLSLMRIYPGTGIEARAREEGVLPRSFSWSQIQVSNDLGLSAAQGNVPLYLGNLNWTDVGALLARWSSARRQSPWNRAYRVLKTIRSFQDVRKVARLARGYLSVKTTRERTPA